MDLELSKHNSKLGLKRENESQIDEIAKNAWVLRSQADFAFFKTPFVSKGVIFHRRNKPDNFCQ